MSAKISVGIRPGGPQELSPSSNNHITLLFCSEKLSITQAVLCNVMRRMVCNCTTRSELIHDLFLSD